MSELNTFVPGMWFEQGGTKWVRSDDDGLWWTDPDSDTSALDDGVVRALRVSVHKPETPVVMVKCHVPDGKYLGQELPDHMKGKDLRVITESAITDVTDQLSEELLFSINAEVCRVLVIDGGNGA